MHNPENPFIFGEIIEAKFAEKVLRAAGPWDRVKGWVTRFGRSVKPDINYNVTTGQVIGEAQRNAVDKVALIFDASGLN
jgi:hypothetical protein